MISRSLRHGAVGLIFLLGSGCAALSGESEDPTEGMTVTQIYEEASSALKGGDYEAAILLYERLESRFRASVHHECSKFTR